MSSHPSQASDSQQIPFPGGLPGESEEYREARNRLLDRELELRRSIEAVAAARRELPSGGAVPEDYVFDGRRGDVRFSELFAPDLDTLAIYSFMYPRALDDDGPCPSCTSILDVLDRSAPHLQQRINLAVVAKAPLEKLLAYADERGWSNLRLLSSATNSYNRDYLAEGADGAQRPIMNVFVRDGDERRHSWATELLYAPWDADQEPRHLDSIWPLWHVLDMTPDGRGTESNFPRLSYD
jgi:predicted dithiol-disulfide oxidoreductase (DUF899 family)